MEIYITLSVGVHVFKSIVNNLAGTVDFIRENKGSQNPFFDIDLHKSVSWSFQLKALNQEMS